MFPSNLQQQVFAALELLKAGRRDEAAELLTDVIGRGPPNGDQWKNIGKLAAQIGEIELSLEATRRFAATPPVKLSAVLHYLNELVGVGRIDAAEQEIVRYGAVIGDHPAVLHVLGQLAAQKGEFETASSFYLRVVDDQEVAPHAWFSLSAISDMSHHPDWIDRMVALDRDQPNMDNAARARLAYALGKSFHDCGDHARAMSFYTRGADARRTEGQYNPEKAEQFALSLIRDFRPAAMQALTPPGHREKASIFVNGLPRSGTTLVEQILVAHSAVHDGGEINLARPALIPTLDYSYAGAIAYQHERSDLSDPWGAIAKQYRRMLDMRFRSSSLVVDKSLNQSHFMGLIAHTLPDSPVIWMRRDPADVAISCFRTFFTTPLPWCWRFGDMGHFFAVEDALFTHWVKVLGDRLLVVDYQELASNPQPVMRQIAAHACLEWEDGMARFHETKRSVRTASLQQVRQPISTARIGQAEPYSQWLDDFWRSYETSSKRIAAEILPAISAN